MVGLNVSAVTSSGASGGVLRNKRSRHSEERFLISGRAEPLVCVYVQRGRLEGKGLSCAPAAATATVMASFSAPKVTVRASLL
jgi:hypothetical protein